MATGAVGCRQVGRLQVQTRITKPAVYAEQGIPFYWRIEAEPRLFCHHLDPATGTYALHRELAPGEKADLTEPWSLSVDTGEFVMPDKR